MTPFVSGLADAAIVLAVGLTMATLFRQGSASVRHAILATAIVAAFLMPAFELALPQVPVVRWGGPAAVVSSGPTLTSEVTIAGTDIDGTAATTGGGAAWAGVLLVVWMSGAIILSARLIGGLARLSRLRSRCMPVTGRWRELADELARQGGVGRHVVVLQSADPSLLVTSGMRNPRIILPAGAARWSEDRMRIVLRHEMAHVERHDAAIQIVGEWLRVVQWINPLVWIACRRLRQESEHACDDAVLNEGVPATDYASHLLDVARHLSGRPALSIAVPAIAHPSMLQRRIVAMLERHRKRAPVSRRGWSVAALVAAVIGIPLAAAGVAPAEPGAVARPAATDVTLQPATRPAGADADTREAAASATAAAPARMPAAEAQAASQPATSRTPTAVGAATVNGQVQDQSGGMLPGTLLTLTDMQTGAQWTMHTNAAGRFAFGDLQAGRYELVASLPGFMTVRNVLTLVSDGALQRIITLPIGSIAEHVTIVCSAPTAANEPHAVARAPNRSQVAELLQAAARLREALRGVRVFPVLSAQEPPVGAPIRVGGSIKEPRKIRDVTPTCPATVPPGDTTLRLTGHVDVDGFINKLALHPIRPGVPPPADLAEAALQAVSQWRYTPTLLNGQPVEVNVAVTIVFRR